MKVYTIARNSPRIFYSLTGLSVNEFDKLNKHFSRFLCSIQIHGRPHTLYSSAHKLFFILFYYRHYMTQELFAFILRVDQAQVCRWIKLLMLPFQKCTGYYIHKAKKKIQSLEQLKEICPEVNLIIDATERPINTPKVNQGRVYSGKKKRHTIKNQIIINNDDKSIVDCSPTYVGKVHDFKVLKKNHSCIPKGAKVMSDTGYIGINETLPDNQCLIPYKASKNYPLNDFQKAQNTIISSMRVAVEHVIALLKHNQILYQEFRGSRELANSSIQSLAGLYNFKLQCRHS